MSTSSVTTVVTFDESGGQDSVSVPVDASFSIQMEASPLQRYWWYLEGDLPDCLVETRSEYKDSTNPSGIWGFHGILTRNYTVLRPCAATLRFRYKEAWAPDSESDAMITVDISVQDPPDST